MKLLREQVPLVLLAGSRGAQGINLASFVAVTLDSLAKGSQDACGRVFGGMVETSSIVALYITIGGLLNAFFVPIVSSLVDGPRKYLRFTFLASCHTGWMLIVLFQALFVANAPSASSESLLIYFISILLGNFIFDVASVLQLAYLPETTNNENEVTYVSSISAFLSAIAGIVLAVVATIISIVLDLDGLEQGVTSSWLVVLFWVPFALPGLYKLSKLSDDSQTNSAGSKDGVNSLLSIVHILDSCRAEFADVGLFLLGFSFYMPAVGSSIGLATGYLQNAINLSPQGIAIATVIVLLSSVPSSLLTSKLQRRFGIKKTLQCSLVLWTVSAILIPWTTQAEWQPVLSNTTISNSTLNNATCSHVKTESWDEQMELVPTEFTKVVVNIFAMVWGVAIGMVFSAGVSLYAVIIPGGQESGFFGARAFCQNILGWCPGLLYTLINEVTGKLNIALFSTSIFFIIGFVFISLIDVERASHCIRPTLSRRRSLTTGMRSAVVVPSPIHADKLCATNNN